jgi:hypothetical protein
VCAVIAGAASTAPAADAATCNPCNIGPPVRLSIQGSQGNQSVIAYYGGGDQVDWQFFPYFGPPTEPSVTFLANDGTFQSTVPVQVQATDALSCVSDTGGSPRTFKWFHDSAVEAGSASVTYLPHLNCPTGYSVWASDQDATAVDIYGHATAIAAFNWGPYGN